MNTGLHGSCCIGHCLQHWKTGWSIQALSASKRSSDVSLDLHFSPRQIDILNIAVLITTGSLRFGTIPPEELLKVRYNFPEIVNKCSKNEELTGTLAQGPEWAIPIPGGGRFGTLSRLRSPTRLRPRTRTKGTHLPSLLSHFTTEITLTAWRVEK